MPKTAPVVVQSEHLDAEAAQWLAERCRLIACPHDSPGFSAAMADADALLVRTYTIVDQSMLSKAPKLKVVGRAGVGLDNIDVAACRARSIEVVYTPDANTQAVVEYVFALLLDVLRPRATLQRAPDAKEWHRLREETVGRRQLNELTIGLLGLGRVGKGVATAAAALGCRVLFNDIATIPAEQRVGAQSVSVHDLFAQADVVSIHIDGRGSNRHFVSRDLIARMKPDAMFINTSRGFVVDNLSLAKFMRDHPASIACLDVHEPEPFGADYPLLGLPNVSLYPHLASRTVTAMRNMSWVVRDVWAVLEGRKPEFAAPRA